MGHIVKMDFMDVKWYTLPDSAGSAICFLRGIESLIWAASAGRRIIVSSRGRPWR